MRSPELTQYFRGGIRSAEQKRIASPSTCWQNSLKTKILVPLCHQCVSLAHVMKSSQAAVHQHILVIVRHQVLDFTLLLAEKLPCFFSLLSLCWIASMPLWPISHMYAIGKFANSRLCPIMQIINKMLNWTRSTVQPSLSPPRVVLSTGLQPDFAQCSSSHSRPSHSARSTVCPSSPSSTSLMGYDEAIMGNGVGDLIPCQTLATALP